MQYLDPQPVGATLAAYYAPVGDAAYPDNRERPAKELKPLLRWALHHLRGYPAPTETSRPLAHRLRAKGALAKANDRYRYLPYVGDGRLLDVGCGSGEYVRTMGQLGWKAEGLSMVESEASRFASATDTQIHQGNIRDLPLSKRFDAITLWHVLEHLPDPKADIEHLRQILAPGGTLGVAIPVMDSAEAQLLGTAWMGYEVPRHLLFFTRKRLQKFLGDSGFDVLGMHSEPRTRSIEMSLPRSNVDWVTRMLLGRKWILRTTVRHWTRMNLNGMVVAWARRRD
jgi:SAM-dependent methyltransferase